MLLSYPIIVMTIGVEWRYIFLAQLILTVLVAMYKAPFPAIIINLVNLNVRYTVVALGYNIGAAIFGGGAPFFAALLVHEFNSYSAAGFYIMATAMLSLLGLGILVYRKKTALSSNFSEKQK